MTDFQRQVAAARAKLPPFAEDATCRACGHSDISATYHPKDARLWGDLMERLIGVATSFVPFALLERRCKRCGRQWAELPLDEDGVEVDDG